MSTQGLISITKQGEVQMKIVAGCNGMKINLVVETLDAAGYTLGKPLDEHEIFGLSLIMGFGCPDCLVVMGKETHVSDVPEEVPPLYRETFSQAKFNPRWESGKREYYHEVKIT